VVWAVTGVLLIEYTKKGYTITEVFEDTIKKLKTATAVIKILSCFMIIAEFTKLAKSEITDKCGFIKMEHQPYSLDLAPSNYYLFS
jgi:hypothetical protein